MPLFRVSLFLDNAPLGGDFEILLQVCACILKIPRIEVETLLSEHRQGAA